jgi:hypothetical protein
MVVEALSESTARRLTVEFASLCGHLNVLHARMVDMVAEALEVGAWSGPGLRSPEHWLAWQTGMSPARAKRIVAMARRRDELPVTFAAFANGELAVDQVAAVVSHTAAHHDDEACGLAKNATVSQLGKALARFRYADGTKPKPAAGAKASAAKQAKAIREQAARDATEAERIAAAVAPGRLSHGFTDDGRFTLHLELPADEGAVIDQALREAHNRLFHTGQKDVSWADAIVDVAHRSLAAVQSPDRRDQYRTYIHLDTEGAWINDGPAIPQTLFDNLTCDGAVRPLWESEGTPINVGRQQHAIPPHTRRTVLDRDRTCRYPGCPNARHLEVHHVLHWARDHGGTDTDNLAAHCPFHHDAIHRGHCTVTGNADHIGGLTHRLKNGTVIIGHNSPAPPGATPPPSPPPGHTYRHPLGEPIHHDTFWLSDPPPADANACRPKPPERVHRRGCSAPMAGTLDKCTEGPGQLGTTRLRWATSGWHSSRRTRHKR